MGPAAEGTAGPAHVIGDVMTTAASADPDRSLWRLLGRIETIAYSAIHDDEEARQLIRDAIAAFDARPTDQ